MEFSSHTFKPHQKPLFLCMFVCSNTIDAYVQYFSILRRLNGTPKNKTKRRCDQECSGMLLVHRRLLFTYCLWQRSDQNETKMRRNSDVRPTFHRWDIFFATRGQCKLIHRASQADRSSAFICTRIFYDNTAMSFPYTGCHYRVCRLWETARLTFISPPLSVCQVCTGLQHHRC